ncbi:MAG: hypothetical protein KF780_07850 [Sphingomonas sp.]|nr:hypothetical protein [Sphingomonas sp.]
MNENSTPLEAGARSTVNVAQVFNVALVSGVFAVMASEIANNFETLKTSLFSNFFSIFAMLLPFFWSIKIFVDDHKHFENVKKGADLFITVIFSIAVYCGLISSISSFPDIDSGLILLAISFGSMSLWTIISVGREMIWPRRNTEEVKKRVLWLLINLLCMALVIFKINGITSNVAFAMLMSILFIADILLSGTFEAGEL